MRTEIRAHVDDIIVAYVVLCVRVCYVAHAGCVSYLFDRFQRQK